MVFLHQSAFFQVT
jgi:hypothetical protein